LWAAAFSSAGAQPTGNIIGLSKNMSRAVHFYEKGMDLEAMDMFMEILVKGDPLERPMANEYLNLLTQRMAIGATFLHPATPPGVIVDDVRPRRPSATVKNTLPPARRLPPSSVRAEGAGPLRSQGISRGDRGVMRREIEGKIRNRTRVLLNQLRKYQDLEVRMANSRLPRAIGIPAGLLFDSGTRFKREAGKILSLMSHLIFSLGATQILILPERAMLGDAKIMDMRRTMGISSHFLKAGIAPPRVRVNLLSSQVDVPRDMRDFTGIMILFVYNQPLTLSTESTIGTESGPPISLGASPGIIDPRKDEGMIVEFSVVEPPAGLMSWRFQLFGPGNKGGDLVPLQEVRGSQPVFHQIYWNGRKKYFGPALAPGRYEGVLTATDLRNRSRKRHLWLKVEGRRAAPVVVKKSKIPPARLKKRRSRKGRRLTSRRKRGRTITRRSSRKRRGTRSARRRPRRTARKKPAKEILSQGDASRRKTPPVERPTRGGAVNYQVGFVSNTPNITQDGENILGRVADTMHYYTLDNINLVGYANSGETNAETLANDRAKLVAKLLVERHGMKRERIRVQTKVTDSPAPKVEIYITAGGT
ncbi:MAG: OmpA family protein, partial [Elusimicrobiota bacterium]